MYQNFSIDTASKAELYELRGQINKVKDRN
jgi:hypothetical protein